MHGLDAEPSAAAVPNFYDISRKSAAFFAASRIAAEKKFGLAAIIIMAEWDNPLEAKSYKQYRQYVEGRQRTPYTVRSIKPNGQQFNLFQRKVRGSATLHVRYSGTHKTAIDCY